MAAYLVWKIRLAEKGRVRIGPCSVGPGAFKVLPLRMGAETVTALDEARARLGLKSRMELIRRALQVYLEQAGELEVAALLSGCPGEDGCCSLFACNLCRVKPRSARKTLRLPPFRVQYVL